LCTRTLALAVPALGAYWKFFLRDRLRLLRQLLLHRHRHLQASK